MVWVLGRHRPSKRRAVIDKRINSPTAEKRRTGSIRQSPAGRNKEPASAGPGYAWPLSWQRAVAHQRDVHRPSTLAAFADRPHHQGLAAAHIAGGKQPLPGGLILDGIGQDIAALVQFDAGLI